MESESFMPLLYVRAFIISNLAIIIPILFIL